MSVKKLNNKNYNVSLENRLMLIHIIHVKYLSISVIFGFLVFSVGKKNEQK